MYTSSHDNAGILFAVQVFVTNEIERYKTAIS